MNKNNLHTKQINQDLERNKSIGSNKIKTTNVNILLNRVRLDQKKTLRKRVYFSLSIIFSISFLAIYLSIK